MGWNVATYYQEKLKARFENSYNYASTMTIVSEKRLVFFKKSPKEVSKILAEAASELWIECTAAIKLIEQIQLSQSELDQQLWRGTQLPSNQPTTESFWQSSTPTPTTPATIANSQRSRSKTKKYNRLRLESQMASSTKRSNAASRDITIGPRPWKKHSEPPEEGAARWKEER